MEILGGVILWDGVALLIEIWIAGVIAFAKNDRAALVWLRRLALILAFVSTLGFLAGSAVGFDIVLLLIWIVSLALCAFTWLRARHQLFNKPLHPPACGVG